VEFPYGDELAYFAYSSDTGITTCSDPEVYDVPAFEGLYLNNKSYIYYCKYTAGAFRGASSASGKAIEFEVPYENSATELFDGRQRDYPGTVLIIAVAKPKYSFEGYGYSRLEFLLLKNGVQYLFVAIGFFLVSFAVAMYGGGARRRLEKYISTVVSWIYFEIKLAALILAVYLVSGASSKIDERFLTYVFCLALPVFYILSCNARYAPRSFFKKSLFYDLFKFLKSIYDDVVPVMPLQVKLRKQILAMFIYGFVLPIVLFFVCDALFGLSAVRIMIPFYILYFGFISALFLRKYTLLVNDISELTRFSSALPLGDRIPGIELNEKDDLYELKSNISKIDESIAAAADLMFCQSNKKMAELLQSINELKEQTALLKDFASPSGEPRGAEELASISKRISAISDKMQDAIMLESPVSAPVLKRIDFLFLLDEVMNDKFAEISAAQLRIHAKLPPPPAYITADMAHIRAALDILFSNLALYALSNSDVELIFKKEGQVWRFIMVNAISPYARSEKSNMTLATGLSLAKEYLALNGGRLEYTSDGNKFGVTFVFPVAH
jgi:signal transduction histidine kinase